MMTTPLKIWNRRNTTYHETTFNSVNDAEQFITDNTKIHFDELSKTYAEDDWIIVSSTNSQLNDLIDNILAKKKLIDDNIRPFNDLQRKYALKRSIQFFRLWNTLNTTDGPINFKRKKEATNFLAAINKTEQGNWQLLKPWDENPPDTHFKI